jgi:RNA-directed DNA polymerase
MKKEMKVLYIERVAIHGGPEPCVGRPRGRQRSVGRGRAGWVIEPRNQRFGVPTLLREAEGNIAGGVYRESLADPARS